MVEWYAQRPAIFQSICMSGPAHWEVFAMLAPCVSLLLQVLARIYSVGFFCRMESCGSQSSGYVYFLCIPAYAYL